MTECRRFRIEGRVQGVWFRESTRQQAELHAIVGYAKNCPDGSVEVVACGPSVGITALRDWLHKGPQLARVSRVEEYIHEDPSHEDFSTG